MEVGKAQARVMEIRALIAATPIPAITDLDRAITVLSEQISHGGGKRLRLRLQRMNDKRFLVFCRLKS